MSETTTVATAVHDPVAPHLLELLTACRDLMATEPSAVSTLRDAWLVATEGERLVDAEDRRLDVERDYISAGWRKYNGRIRYAAPGFDERQGRVPFTPAFRRRLRARWPWCVYCGGHGTEVDHIWPLARGGTNGPRNLVPCCQRCNLEKRDKLIIEWRAARQGRKAAWPPSPFWSPAVLEHVQTQYGVEMPPCGPSCLPDSLR